MAVCCVYIGMAAWMMYLGITEKDPHPVIAAMMFVSLAIGEKNNHNIQKILERLN